jgi:O-methyltransferase domain
LHNTRAAISRGDRLLLAEAILPPGNEPHPSKDMDVTMLLWGDGRERTLEEYRDLLDGAGLQLSRVVSLPPNPLGLALIESVVAG